MVLREGGMHEMQERSLHCGLPSQVGQKMSPSEPVHQERDITTLGDHTGKCSGFRKTRDYFLDSKLIFQVL